MNAVAPKNEGLDSFSKFMISSCASVMVNNKRALLVKNSHVVDDMLGTICKHC